MSATHAGRILSWTLSRFAAPKPADAVVRCESLVHICQTGSVEVQALQGLDLVVAPGEMIAVVGASGSGRSTLLSILAGIESPAASTTSAEVFEAGARACCGVPD
ncbi:ATP-binding cassette domain-containing protein [Dactylosporangium sp. CA-233914]|uniref:ATP-binding cassette domain-containing protein n=1 Tax=Dactylosporangium sp. CA-233914 TaxID=3239934 RepID=UPI003D8AFFBF